MTKIEPVAVAPNPLRVKGLPLQLGRLTLNYLIMVHEHNTTIIAHKMFNKIKS